eukprot:6456217-Amphidinium_carterae.3
MQGLGYIGAKPVSTCLKLNSASECLRPSITEIQHALLLEETCTCYWTMSLHFLHHSNTAI